MVKINDKLRDKSRDKLSEKTQSILPNGTATLAPRKDALGMKDPREKIGKGVFWKSLGIIDISEGPIKWCHVLRRDSKNNRKYRVEYAVPDSAIASKIHDISLSHKQDDISIKTDRVKKFPIFGKVVDMNWKSNRKNLKLVNSLNNDTTIKKTIMDTGNIEIRSYVEHGCWMIRVSNPILRSHRPKHSTKEEWICYLKITEYLLSSYNS